MVPRVDAPYHIKDLRLQKGYTQEQMARKVGMTLRHYTKTEKGENMPRIDRALRIAEVLNVKVEEIAEWTDYRSIPC